MRETLSHQRYYTAVFIKTQCHDSKQDFSFCNIKQSKFIILISVKKKAALSLVSAHSGKEITHSSCLYIY